MLCGGKVSADKLIRTHKTHEISVRYFVMSLLVKFSMQTAPARMSAVLFSVCFIN